MSTHTHITLEHDEIPRYIREWAQVRLCEGANIVINGEPPERAEWFRRAAREFIEAAEAIEADHAQSLRDLAETRADVTRMKREKEARP